MSRNLIIFLIVSALALGSVGVYAMNQKNIDKNPNNNKSNVLSEFDVNTNTSSDSLSIPSASDNNSKAPAPEVKELKIEDIKVGTGAAVKNGDTLEVNYIGTFLDGRKFDSSYDRGQTFSFVIGQGSVIRGWDQGLIGMQVGGKRKLTIPSDLAYGQRGAPGAIPPNTPLLFEIELVSIK